MDTPDCESTSEFQSELHVSTINTTPFADHFTTTNFQVGGLETNTLALNQPNYIENFVQSVFNIIKSSQHSLVVGGLGDTACLETILKIVAVGAGNGIEKIYTGTGGIISRASMSLLTVKYKTWGFLMHKSCRHSVIDPMGFCIDLISPDGNGISLELLDDICMETQEIRTYKTVIGIEYLKLSSGLNRLFKIGTAQLVIEVVDAVSEYIRIMESIFNFDKISDLLTGRQHNRPFRLIVDCCHGSAGPYAKRIFETELGAARGSVIRFEPIHQEIPFHPSQLGSTEIEKQLRLSTSDFGALLDSDGGRSVIFGRRGFLVPSGESLSLITSHYHAIPYFVNHKFNGIARSLFTPSSADDISQMHHLKLFETSGNWQEFNKLMDSKDILLCEDEEFGLGSNHIKQKDGIWGILAWLTLVAHIHKPVKDIVLEHWRLHGRYFLTQYEFHNLLDSSLNQLMNSLLNEKFQQSHFLKSTWTVGDNTYIIVGAENITSPIESGNDYNVGNSIIKILVEPKGRIMFRSVIREERGILLIAVEQHKTDECVTLCSPVATRNLFELAMMLGNVNEFTGKNTADLIY